jgi:hypothetical protein
MPEMNDNDFRKLFQTAGRIVPKRDLADRIMARVAVTRVADPTPVPPLISKRGWTGIAGMALLVVTIAATISGSPAAAPSLPYADTITNWLSELKLPEGQWSQWVIGASFLALFFAVLMRKAERSVTV